MQYEMTILELMERVKRLELELDAMKQAMAAQAAPSLPATEDEADPADGKMIYSKVTAEMIDACYIGGKKIHEGGNITLLADEVSRSTGMKRSTAIMFLYAVDRLLSGKIFKRGISLKGLQVYLERILEEYGKEGLQKALYAMELHIAYRKQCGLPIASTERLCAGFRALL